VHIKSWEKGNVNDGNSNHDDILEIKAAVESVWHLDSELLRTLRLRTQMLPGLEAAEQLSCDSNGI
jgi:hypothetical protein